MAVLTVDKAILIIVVTAIIIVLAYVFRLGGFSKRKKTGTGTEGSQQGPSTPS